MMAGPGISGDKLLLLQAEIMCKNLKLSPDVIKTDQENKKKVYAVILSEKDTAKIRIKINKIYSKPVETDPLLIAKKKEQIDLFIKEVTTTELLSLIRFDPCPVLRKVKCPVLAINGDKDTQVPSKQNLKAVQTCLTEGGNSNVTIKELWYLNHLFQTATTGEISEYYEIEETVSPIALETMTEWLNGVVKNK
jgi:uncharacterized protein